MPDAVLATFREPGAAAAVILALRARGFSVRAAMPAPFPEVVTAVGERRSGVDRAAFVGALAGVAIGAAVTSGTSLAWPLRTGGMPVVSVPPFALVSFETTVLLGSLAIVGALVAGAWRGRTPVLPAGEGLDDRIAVVAAGGDGAEAERILRAGGGEEVRRAG